MLRTKERKKTEKTEMREKGKNGRMVTPGRRGTKRAVDIICAQGTVSITTLYITLLFSQRCLFSLAYGGT